MAKLKINGQSVTVDDSFLHLSPDEQNATVDEIAKSLSQRQGSTGSGVPVAPAAPKENPVQDFARSIRGGIPFGDRIAAAAKSVPVLGNGQGYEQNLEAERSKSADLAERHPYLNFAGNMVGGLASTLPLMPLTAARSVLTAPTLAGRVAEGAKVGAGYGALQGASEAPDLTAPGSVAGHAAAGAAGGAVLGAGLPMAAKGVGSAYGKVAGYFQPFGENMSAATGRSILRDFGKAGPGEIENEVKRLGPDAMLVDAAPSLLSKGQGVIENSRDARNLFTERLTKRDQGTSDRLISDFEKNIGKTPSKTSLEDALITRRKRQEAVDFGRSLRGETPPVDTSELAAWIDKEIEKAGPSRKKALLGIKNHLYVDNPEFKGNLGSVDFMPEMPVGRVVGARDRVRALGGVRDEGGDLTSANVQKLYRGIVNQKNGKPLDKVRETLAQEGYFDHLYGSPEEAVKRSTPQDLKDAILENSTRAMDAEEIAKHETIDALGGKRGVRRNAKAEAAFANSDAPPEKILSDDANYLHELKGDIGALLKGEDRLGVRGKEINPTDASLNEVYKRLSDHLSVVPGYREGVERSAALHGQQDALNEGYSLYGSGKGSVRPEDLANRLDSLAQKDNRGDTGKLLEAFRMGDTAKRRDVFGNSPNDLQAAKRVVGGENDYTRGHMEQLYGKRATDNLVAAADREQHFRNNKGALLHGSQTAPRSEAAKAERGATLGDILHPVKSLAEKALRRVQLPINPQYYGEVADILSAQGAERDKYLKVLADALRGREASSANGAKVGNAAALAAALSADQSGKNLLRSRSLRDGR
jgi:hypothetical protein